MFSSVCIKINYVNNEINRKFYYNFKRRPPDVGKKRDDIFTTSGDVNPHIT